MEELFDKESDASILITAKNLEGTDVPAAGSYLIYALDENDSVRNEVQKGEFKTGTQVALKKQLSRLRSGKYRIKLQSKDDRGNSVEAEKDLILYSYSDKRPPYKTNNWFVMRSKTFSPKEAAEVLVGATEEIYLLYELWQEEKLMERKWISIKNENKRITIPYKEEYGVGVTLMLAQVKSQKFTNHHIDLLRKEDKKEVKVKLDLFRDKIRPGSEEEWRLTVTDEKGNPVAAELLASMYDFSLDQIYPTHEWNLPNAFTPRYRSALRFSQDNSFYPVSNNIYFSVPRKSVPGFQFDQFNWYDFSFFNQRMLFRSATVSGIGRGVTEKQMMLAESVVMDSPVSVDAVAGIVAEEAAPKAEAPTPSPQSPVQIRKNFNETAFFYPRLRTNEKGETQIAFTVPESNTRWRFRVLAHDKELNSGSAEAFTVSRKELMVTPNLPRFLREGDKTLLSTKISNLSDKEVTGIVRLELFDPFTSPHIPYSA